MGAVDEIFEVDGFGVGGDGVHVFTVGAVPESPMVGGAVVVPADAAGGIGHEVGADVADGVESDLEFESGVGEGVAVAVELDAEVAGVGVDFEIVVVAAPAPAVALASAFMRSRNALMLSSNVCRKSCSIDGRRARAPRCRTAPIAKPLPLYCRVLESFLLNRPVF